MHLGQLLGFIRGLGNRHVAALTKTLVFRPMSLFWVGRPSVEATQNLKNCQTSYKKTVHFMRFCQSLGFTCG